jgi:hypothetical protein
MAEKKGMKWYPAELRAKVIAKFHTGESQRSLSREYGISRRAIQDWLKDRQVGIRFNHKHISPAFSVIISHIASGDFGSCPSFCETHRSDSITFFPVCFFSLLH